MAGAGGGPDARVVAGDGVGSVYPAGEAALEFVAPFRSGALVEGVAPPRCTGEEFIGGRGDEEGFAMPGVIGRESFEGDAYGFAADRVPFFGRRSGAGFVVPAGPEVVCGQGGRSADGVQRIGSSEPVPDGGGVSGKIYAEGAIEGKAAEGGIEGVRKIIGRPTGAKPGGGRAGAPRPFFSAFLIDRVADSADELEFGEERGLQQVLGIAKMAESGFASLRGILTRRPIATGDGGDHARGGVRAVGLRGVVDQRHGEAALLGDEGGGAPGEAAAVVESVKAASDIYAPIGGEVIEVNETLTAEPGTINNDAFGAGWLFKLKPSDPTELDKLLTPEDYEKSLG